MKNLFLIDANSIIHRSFHALPPLTTSNGKPVNALYGLTSVLLKLWREDKPDYAAALFDRPEPTFRKEKFEEYKAQRPKAMDELVSQIIDARNLFPHFGIRTFELPGFEADDLIATFAEKCKYTPDLLITILTGDMDTLQLVDDNRVLVRAFKKGITETVTYDTAAVEERYGLKPNQMIDYKALVGDPSDNIKGVPGVGPKTAVELIKKLGNVESIYREAGRDPKLGARLLQFKKEALLAKELVTLERNVPVEVRLEELKIEDKTPELKKYLGAMGFKTLLARLEGGEPVKAHTVRKLPKKKDQAMF